MAGEECFGFDFKVLEPFVIDTVNPTATAALIRCRMCHMEIIGQVPDYIRQTMNGESDQINAGIRKSVDEHVRTVHPDIDPTSVVL